MTAQPQLQQEQAPQEQAAPPQPQPRCAAARLLHAALADVPFPCQFTFAQGETLHLGPPGEPAFSVVFHSDAVLGKRLDEYAIGRAYVEGQIEIEGDVLAFLSLRQHAKKGNVSPGFLMRAYLQLLWSNRIRLNRDSIAHHYNFGDDFYLAFVDRQYHLYSHCLFHSDDETLEQAAEHKFATMARALRLQAGSRLLDIGAGWGAVTRYAGPRDIHCTALTIAEDSHRLHQDLIADQGLATCQVRLEDFLAHEPPEPYDAIVIFGVIEHIPHYRDFVAQVWKCLKPGGRIYLDASATLEKYKVSNFVRRYIYPGTHTYLCLPDLLQEFLMHGFKVEEVVDETHEYALTLGHWAARFEANRQTIVERWGEAVFRAFRLYLWGGSHAMHNHQLQAYHVVAQRTENPGIQPGFFKRLLYFIRSLN